MADTNIARLENLIQRMERRMDGLDREKRFQDDRIRNLERQINDLRRREGHPYS
jgi:hypothetical protein